MAKDFSVVVPHQLPAAEAQQRIKSLLQDLKKIYATQISDVQEDWKGNTCTFSMKMSVFRIKGAITMGSDGVVIQGKMPPGTGKYEGRVKALIEDRAKSLLAVKPPPPPKPLEHPGFG